MALPLRMFAFKPNLCIVSFYSTHNVSSSIPYTANIIL